MVGAKQVDGEVEATCPLVDVIGGVGSKVGVFAIGLDQDAVLVITEVSGAQPRRPVELEHVTLLSEARKSALDRPTVMQRPLGRPHVEVSAEQVEHVLLLRELQSIGGFTERGQLFVLWKFTDARVLGHDQRGEIDDVGTVVSVLGHGLAVSCSHDGRTELVHLHTAVIDVELTRDCGPCGHEHACKRIADGCPTRVTQMQWACGIG